MTPVPPSRRLRHDQSTSGRALSGPKPQCDGGTAPSSSALPSQRLDASQGGLSPHLACYARMVLVPGRTIEEWNMATTTEPLESEMAATALGHRWGWLLALGIVQIIAGWIAIAIPVVASYAAVAIFGAVLLGTALFQLIHAFRVRAWPRYAWYVLRSAFYAIAGLLMPINPVTCSLALAFII